MKKNLLIVLVALIFICCKKNDELINDSLIGKWNWISTSGGFAGIHDTPKSTGKTHILVFTKDSVCNSYENGVLISQRKFHVRKNTTEKEVDSPYLLCFDENDLGSRFIIKENNLIFNDSFVDGFLTIYERIK